MKDYLDTSLPFERRADDLISRMNTKDKAGQLLHAAPAIPELGIPEYNYWNECLHGIARAGKATVFPQAITMAASFDEELLQRIAAAISDEARARYHESVRQGNRAQYKGLTFWTPNINIFRDPRWGRGQETYGEDPFLTSVLGCAFVRGLQGSDPKYLKTSACAKHFAVHSGPEKKRHEFNAIATPQDMEETYLPAFKALVDSGVESVMGAYNRTNGEACCGSRTLLQKILRDQWGFQGHVVSDCGAIRDFHQHHGLSASPEESVSLALKNGCDLNCGCTYQFILLALEKGLIEEADIDRALKRVLMTRFRLGMFDPDEMVPYSSAAPETIHCRAHRALALEAAEKGIVLLKNKDGTLPIKNQYRRILLTGSLAGDLHTLIGNYSGYNGSMTSFLEGIFERTGENIQIDYKPAFQAATPNACPIHWGLFDSKSVDLCIICAGLSHLLEGEEGDAIASPEFGDRQDLRLPQPQRDYIARALETGVPVVLVLSGGSPIDISEFEKDLAAVIWAGYPGEAGGTALARILYGDTSPSGKLPVTFPRGVACLPDFEDYSMRGRTYKYMTEEPLYPFGFGLTYSSVEITEFTLDSDMLQRESIHEQNIRCTVRALNHGPLDTDEVIQLYLGRESLQDPALEMVPAHELISFTRAHLRSGEEKTLTISVPAERIASVTKDGKRKIIPGDYRISAGFSLPCDRSAALGAPEARSVTLRCEE